MNTPKTRKTILCCILVLILAFAGFSIYSAWNYTRRCVRISPKNDIRSIEIGRTYTIEDFFSIEREKSTDNRVISIHWENGTTDNIDLQKDGSFTVTEGSGNLTISLSDRNPDSPEDTSESVTVPVQSENT